MIYRDVPLTDLPQGHFKVVLADPPWRFLVRSEKGMDRSADNHYPTMNLDAIKALPVRDLCDKHAVLFMWVIDTHAEMAFDVIKAWGFKFKTVGLYWAKTNADGSFFTGMGFWTRANPEHAYEAWLDDGDQEVDRCLLASTGAPKRVGRDVRRLIVAPRREHSRKPDESLASIERLVDGPYLELFSRSGRIGWSSWGSEVGMFKRQLPDDVRDLI